MVWQLTLKINQTIFFMLWIKISSVFLKVYVYSFGTRHKYFGKISQLYETRNLPTTTFRKKAFIVLLFYFFQVSVFHSTFLYFSKVFLNSNCFWITFAIRFLITVAGCIVCMFDHPQQCVEGTLFSLPMISFLLFFVNEIHGGTGALHLYKKSLFQLNSRQV